MPKFGIIILIVLGVLVLAAALYSAHTIRHGFSTRTSASGMVLAHAINVHLRGIVKECRDPKDDMFLSVPCVQVPICWSLATKISWFSAPTKERA